MKEQKTYETDVGKLLALFDECLTRPQSYYDQANINRDTRYCVWPGQTPDGRKWVKHERDAEIFPWPGASDVRVPLVDTYAREDGAVLQTALSRMRIVANGVESGDEAYAQRTTNFIKWMLYNQMTERTREARYLGNFMLDQGKAVLGVFWDRQVQMGYQILRLETLAKLAEAATQQLQQDEQMAANPPPEGQEVPPPLTAEERVSLLQMSQVPRLIVDPAQEDQMAEVLQTWAQRILSENFEKEMGEFKDELAVNYTLPKRAAKQIVKDLRETGQGRLPVPFVTRNRPVFVALALDEDFFLPCSMVDLENAPAAFHREWVTAEQLEGRVLTDGYDEAWVEYVIEHGKGTGGESQGAASGSKSTSPTPGRQALDTSKLYGILHAYEKRCDEAGVPGLHYTVVHPCVGKGKEDGKQLPEGMTQAYAKTELLNYEHGEYPFILFRREYLSRRVDDSRGYGEIAGTGQFVLKKETDMQINRADLTTVPPLHHPKGRPPAKWGPGVKVPASRNEYFFGDIPQGDSTARTVAKDEVARWDRYFGRQAEGVDPILAQLLRQDMVDNWLESWRLAIMQMFQLCQQFMPEQFYFRVVGSQRGKSIRATRAEIQGKFDVTLTFEVENLDPVLRREKLKTVQEIIGALDVNGVTNRDEVMAYAFEMVDANLGERLLKPGEEATQHEIEDEQNVFARLFAGIDVDVKPGQAYGLREKVLTDALIGTDDEGQPKNPDGIKRYQEDGAFKKRYDKRMQQLKFQQQQRENAKIGRLGA